MAAKRKGLGRGLDALINETPAAAPQAAPKTKPAPAPKKKAAPTASAIVKEELPGGPIEVAVEQIRSNPWQPRQEFEQNALDDLTNSIREMGLLQPLLVRKAENGYELIAGERRLTASRAAGLPRVPVIIKEYTDCEALEVALVENLQREDLNIIEEAEGYQVLADKFELTQEQIARRVGKSRASVTNALRMLKLPDEIREMLFRNLISQGHAKVLLGVTKNAEQQDLAHLILKDGLSVRALEAALAKLHKPTKKPRVKKSDIPESHLRYLTDKLHHHFGTGIQLTPVATLSNGKKTKGKIEIEYYSNDDLDRILTLLGITEDL